MWRSKSDEQLSDLVRAKWENRLYSMPNHIKAIEVVNAMVFVHHYIPVDRFFLSLVLHPNDDTSIVSYHRQCDGIALSVI